MSGIIVTKLYPNDDGGTDRMAANCDKPCLTKNAEGHYAYDCPFYAVMGQTEYCMDSCSD